MADPSFPPFSPKLPSPLQDPLLSPGPSLNDFCYGISALQILARQGSWRSILEKIHHARKLSLLQFPHEQLVYHAYLILAHMKLRNYGAAVDEFDALGDLDSPHYRYEHHPSVYPGKTGSLVPFGLRWLHAELPHRLGQASETIERLYRLLNHCHDRVDRLLDRTDLAESTSEITALKNEDRKGFSFDKRSSMELSDVDQVSFSRNVSFEGVTVATDSNNGLSSPAPSASVDVVDADAEADTSIQDTNHTISKGPREGTIDEIVASSAALSLNFPSLPVEPDHGRQHGADTSDTAKEDIKRNLWEQGKGNSAPSPGSDREFGEFVVGAIPTGEDRDAFRGFNRTAVSASVGSALDRWQCREELIVNTILTHHLTQREFVLGLKWLKQILQKHPSDPFLHSKLAYVQMQLGDLTGAKDTFSKVENMVSQAVAGSLSTTRLKGLVFRNKGLQHVVSKQYAAAIKEFDAAIELDPTDVVSANNKALCLMYSKDLIGSTKVLETVLEKEPVVALNESLVLNLCSMYELAFVNNVGIKKSLTDWIMKVAPDDFDLSCTRL